MINKLNIFEHDEFRTKQLKISIINTFRRPIVRLYCLLRFLVIPIRIMDSIGQFIPESGNVLDLGCGFGLFTLYFAKMYPNTRFLGVDIATDRIADARLSAQTLGMHNVEFFVGDALEVAQNLDRRYDAVKSIDLLHHLELDKGNNLALIIYKFLLKPEGMWILEDVSTRPRIMLYFTFLLDLLMNPKDSFYYRSLSCWRYLCRTLGYKNVQCHEVWDFLPYPHFILIAKKDGQNDE